MKKSRTLTNFLKIQAAAKASASPERCMIAPHPEVKEHLKKEIRKLKESIGNKMFADRIKMEETKKPGLNDALMYPGNTFPLGTSLEAARSARASKAPLRGTLRVAVVLVDFPDKPFTKSKKHFEELFFSVGKVATGSVREYFREVSNGLIDIQGEVAGPYRLSKKITQYAHGASGMSTATPNARTMAREAAVKANPDVNFTQYDNDGDNFVDAFVVIHAGTGAETNNNPNDIWSHKWVFDGGAYNADETTKIFSYLTVPEDCTLGVCAHELGHLLFGFPDLYDTDSSSEGIGDWCLMSGGSWNNGGLTPAHPSAWCKCNQGWVNIETPTSNKKNVTIKDVKIDRKVYKLWKNGTPGKEYFLVENRQKTDFDKHLPASGLLIWHIDENMAGNSNEAHYRVALMQADGNKDLEHGNNRGDLGDCFPGSSKKATFDKKSTPGSLSYGGVDTSVAVKKITASGKTIKADLYVK